MSLLSTSFKTISQSSFTSLRKTDVQGLWFWNLYYHYISYTTTLSARKVFYTNQMGFSSSLICWRIARIGIEVLRQFFRLIFIRLSFVCFLHLFGLLNLDIFSAKIFFSFEVCNPFPLCLNFYLLWSYLYFFILETNINMTRQANFNFKEAISLFKKFFGCSPCFSLFF